MPAPPGPRRLATPRATRQGRDFWAALVASTSRPYMRRSGFWAQSATKLWGSPPGGDGRRAIWPRPPSAMCPQLHMRLLQAAAHDPATSDWRRRRPQGRPPLTARLGLGLASGALSPTMLSCYIGYIVLLRVRNCTKVKTRGCVFPGPRHSAIV
eukprot:12625886-Alexandrium_andersonii.AAC.1